LRSIPQSGVTTSLAKLPSPCRKVKGSMQSNNSETNYRPETNYQPDLGFGPMLMQVTVQPQHALWALQLSHQDGPN